MNIIKENTEKALEILGPLDTLLKRGKIAYRNYISNGKCLLYAKIIKNNNEQIRELILEKAHLLPFEHQSKAIDLVTHIDIWYVLWEDLYEREKYNLNDEFIFKNNATFPKESVASLCTLYSDLISKSKYL